MALLVFMFGGPSDGKRRDEMGSAHSVRSITLNPLRGKKARMGGRSHRLPLQSQGPFDKFANAMSESLQDGTAPAPLLSIGLAVYNAERYLKTSAESLLAQTFTDFELIISDNASTDSTGDICRELAARDGRVRYFRNEKNMGAAFNFNRAFHLSRGKYFKFAAYDDLYAPRYLEACLGLLEAEPGAVLVHSKYVDIDSEGKLMRSFESDPRYSASDPAKRFFYLTCANHACVHIFGIMRREVLADGPLIGSYVGSDRALLAELSLKGPFLDVQEPLFLHREHPERSTRAIPDIRRRTVWFDSSQAGKVALPALRLFSEYAKSLWRSRLGIGDKLRCAVQLAYWIRYNQDDVLADLRYWLRGR
jgi:glycosyltransferase involved in cell wall biosynthesis